jgi:pathogenesis-related protein 1
MVLSAAGAPKPHELSPLAVEMLSAHNAFRKQLRLRQLVWSDRLATVAQSWANRLLIRQEFRHQSLPPYGENLFEINGGTATPDDVVHDWASESLDYDYVSNGCHSVCGHYTQIVWRSTAQVGCAVARGSGREVWVCEYNPPGNVVGQRPY